MSKKLWVGLDVGAETMSVCVVNDRGESVLEVAMPPEADLLNAALRPMRRGNVASVALESGSAGLHLARELKRIGYRVSIFDSRQDGKLIGSRQNKTDRNDARCIADVARIGLDVISEVHLRMTASFGASFGRYMAPAQGDRRTEGSTSDDSSSIDVAASTAALISHAQTDAASAAAFSSFASN